MLGFKYYCLKSCVRSVTRFCWAKLLLTRNIRHFLPQSFCNILEVGHLLQLTNPALMSQEEIYELLSTRSQQCKDMQMHCHCSKPHFYSFRPVSKVHCARSWRRLSLGVNTRVCRVCVKMTPGPGLDWRRGHRASRRRGAGPRNATHVTREEITRGYVM